MTAQQELAGQLVAFACQTAKPEAWLRLSLEYVKLAGAPGSGQSEATKQKLRDLLRGLQVQAGIQIPSDPDELDPLENREARMVLRGIVSRLHDLYPSEQADFQNLIVAALGLIDRQPEPEPLEEEAC